MTINRDKLVEDLSLYNIFANKSKKEVKEFIEDFTTLIVTYVSEGHNVNIPSFGKFEKYKKQDGTHKPKFTPFKQFKETVNSVEC